MSVFSAEYKTHALPNSLCVLIAVIYSSYCDCALGREMKKRAVSIKNFASPFAFFQLVTRDALSNIVFFFRFFSQDEFQDVVDQRNILC